MKKAIYLFALVATLTACTTHRSTTVQNSLLIGIWEQSNLTLDLKSNGRYHYHYKENGYSNKQSGKYSYFADKDSVVLYNFYPQAYTSESKNLSWSIRRLTADSLVIYVHKPAVVLDKDTLNTAGNETEIYTRKSINRQRAFF